MNMKQLLSLVTFFCAYVGIAEAYIKCGSWLCYGSGAYCCGDNCCYHVWSLWWFWILWVVVFTCCISCGFWCRRRQRYRPEYIIVRNPEPPIYGTQPVYGAVGNGVQPVFPQKPPEYTNQAPPKYQPN